MERKSFLAKIREVKDKEVEAVVSTEDLDRYNEVILTSAWKKGIANFQKHPVLLAGHIYSDLRANIGEVKSLKVSDEGLIAKIEYYVGEGNELADWGYKLASRQRAAYSVGFIEKESVTPADKEKWNELMESLRDKLPKKAKPRKIYTDVELLEISQVLVPANPEALQKAEQSEDQILAFVAKGILSDEELEKMIKEDVQTKTVIPYKKYPTAPPGTPWNGPKEVKAATVADLKIMCCWYDPDNPDAKYSYKLPHHRQSDKYTVWNGVRAAMAALMGARGGVNIPASDRKGVYNHLAKHYGDFGKEPPEFKEYTEEELKELFPEFVDSKGQWILDIVEDDIIGPESRDLLKQAVKLIEEVLKKTEDPDKVKSLGDQLTEIKEIVSDIHDRLCAVEAEQEAPEPESKQDDQYEQILAELQEIQKTFKEVKNE